MLWGEDTSAVGVAAKAVFTKPKAMEGILTAVRGQDLPTQEDIPLQTQEFLPNKYRPSYSIPGRHIGEDCAS